MIKNAVMFTIAMGLVVGLSLVGCGNKKPGESGADAGDGLLDEADTGPVDYPEPPQVDPSNRNPVKFTVSVKEVHALPLSEDGQCWDRCSQEAKDALVEALPNLSGDQFGSAGKAITTAMGASGTKEVLPDLYVHIDCGFGQSYTTSKSSAEDRIVARWQGAKETFKLDLNDFCAISVWDADDDGNDEMIGDVSVQPLKMTTNGEVFIRADDQDFGQVVMVELFFDQHEGAPVWDGGGTDPGGSTQPPTNPPPGGSTVPPALPGQATYTVEIVKANLQGQKEDGKPWDAKIPFMAGGTMPDPFVAAYINGYQSENSFMETPVAQDTTYKEWRTAAGVNLRSTDKIHFMVWDKDKVDHDLMGECISGNVGSLPQGKPITLRGCGQVDFLVFKITRQ